jgi:hypothetical protein
MGQCLPAIGCTTKPEIGPANQANEVQKWLIPSSIKSGVPKANSRIHKDELEASTDYAN